MEKAEETHTESEPLGKVTRGVQINEGTEMDQVVEGEVSFGLRGLQAALNSREATCQGREICLSY
jgi:hypothetical protein